MFGQGNYAPEYRNRPPAPPSPYQTVHQAPPLQYRQGPQVISYPYQQGPALPRPPLIQQGPSALSTTHNGASTLMPSSQPASLSAPQTAANMNPGMASTGQPYLDPFPPSHGSIAKLPPYPSAQPPPFYTPITPWEPNQSDLSMPPPPRILPTALPPSIQVMYRSAPLLTQPEVRQILPHFHPLTTGPQVGFDPVSAASSSGPGSVANIYPPVAAPPSLPPLPASPPPLPPSPPPPSSPLPSPPDDPAFKSSRKSSEVAEPNPTGVENVVDPQRSASAASGHECKQDHIDEDTGSTKADSLTNLPPAPAKPVDEEVVRNIEVLCQFIAKVGPEFEKLARTKEAGNPKFAFLFGGDPGSAAAIEHDYFQWMKIKCLTGFRCSPSSERSDQASKRCEMASTLRATNLMEKGTPASPTTSSDMDIEDDSNHPEQEENHATLSNEKLYQESLTSPDDGVMGNELPHVPVVPVPKKEDDHSNTTKPNADNPMGSSEELNPVVSLVAVRSHPLGESPLRQIQGYASEDSSEDGKGASADNTSPAVVEPVSALCEEERAISDSNFGGTEIDMAEEQTISLACADNISPAVVEPVSTFYEEERAISDANFASTETDMAEEQTASLAPGKKDPYPYEKAAKDALNSQHLAVIGTNDFGSINKDKDHSELGSFPREKDVNEASVELKVDEFGRLIREGVTDSDSDEVPHYDAKRHRKGDRNRMRSRSPKRNRWRRSRSPPRRRDRRSQSRSRSPRRSNSPPASRSRGDFGSKQIRPDGRGYTQECFNYLAGRCYRGSSCRFLHGGHTSGDASRRNSSRDKQRGPHDYKYRSGKFALGAEEKSKVVAEKVAVEKDVLSEEEGKGPSIDTRKAVSNKDMCGVTEGDVARDSQQSSSQYEEVGHSQMAVAQVQEHVEDQQVDCPQMLAVSSTKAVDVAERLTGDAALHVAAREASEVAPFKSSAAENVIPLQSCSLHAQSSSKSVDVSGEMPGDAILPMCSRENSGVEPSQSRDAEIASLPLPHTAHAGSLPTSYLLPVQTIAVVSNPALRPDFASYPNQMPTDPNCQLGKFASQSLPPKEFQMTTLSASSVSFQTSLVPGEHHPQSFTLYAQHQTLPSGGVLYSSPSNTTWDHLPLPPPPPLPPMGDILTQPLARPYASEELIHSRVREDLMPKSMVVDDQQYPPNVQQGLTREERFMYPSENPKDYSSYAPRLPGSFTTPLSRETPFSQLYSFSGGSLALRPSSKEGLSAPVSSFSYSTQVDVHGGSESCLPRYVLPNLIGNVEPKLSRTIHYNPFASTFEQAPTSSKFELSVPMPETGSNFSSKYDSPFIVSHVSVAGKDNKSGIGSMYTSSTPDSKRPREKLFSVSGESFPEGTSRKLNDHVSSQEPSVQKHSSRHVEPGDQYDPILDSIEPSSDSSKKLKLTRVVDDSNSKLRLISLHRPLDVEENNKQKGDGAAIINPSVNEAFDETGNEEIGDLDNVSLGNQADNSGEIEIDQIQFSPEKKKKKSKDSRSMKLFKIALANFVKEVLKPSWRQGNMSKEAFKTIVKKTVDKVSGAMQGHRIPKTQTKIDQYVESQQRKLTKLVMGYVDKYVKL